MPAGAATLPRTDVPVTSRELGCKPETSVSPTITPTLGGRPVWRDPGGRLARQPLVPRCSALAST